MKVYFDAEPSAYPGVDDLAPMPAPALPARPARRGLSNWQVAVIYAMIHTGIVTVIVMLATGDNYLGMLSLALHGAMLFFGLCIGVVAGRL